MSWQQAQKWELDWWSTCQNTFGEEEKQLIYAEKMGLIRTPDDKTPYRFDLHGISVLDIGGGPSSLLLKCANCKSKVIDPLPLPEWVKLRYKTAGIDYEQKKGEDITESGFDEVWLYNVLEHTDNPERVIQNAQKAGKIIRLFEWVDTMPSPGHPHTFTESSLNKLLKGEGKVEIFARGRTRGKGYFGVFIC